MVIGGGPVRVDQGETFPGVLFRQQALQGQVGVIRVGVITGDILERQPLGLDHVVEHLRRIPRPLGQVHLLQDVEHLQGGKTLAVGRQFIQLVAAIVHLGRLHPLAPVGGQVPVGHVGADALEIVVHAPRQLALVKGLAAAASDGFKSRPQVRVAEYLPGRRGAAIREPGGVDIGQQVAARQSLLEGQLVALQVIGDDRRYRKALARILDSRRQQLRHGQLAKTLVDGKPAVHRARHGYRQLPQGRNAPEIRRQAALRLHGR